MQVALKELWKQNGVKRLGHKHTPEAIAKMVGRKHSPETKAKIAAKALGRKRPDLTERNKLALHKGKPRKQHTVRIVHPSCTFKGRKHSPETLAKMRAAWAIRRATTAIAG
jgi:hypothetical protein